MLPLFDLAEMPERQEDQLLIIDSQIQRLEDSIPPNGDYARVNLQLRKLEQARERITKSMASSVK